MSKCTGDSVTDSPAGSRASLWVYVTVGLDLVLVEEATMTVEAPIW